MKMDSLDSSSNTHKKTDDSNEGDGLKLSI